MKGQFFAADESQMLGFGASIFKVMNSGIVFLNGDLGMGKTTLSKGIIRAAGHLGTIKSPTYTIVEPYELCDQSVYHFDLYRLAEPEELEYLGIRDYFSSSSLCLIEWPQRGVGFLPQADLLINITYYREGRILSFDGGTAKGIAAADKLQQIVDQQ